MNDNQQLLDVLTREGVLVAVNVRYWRARKKLDAQDVGLDPDDVTERLISLGHKRLLPREALAQFALIESRAHAVVDAATFPFLGGIGRSLNFAGDAELEAQLDRARRELLSRTAVEYRDSAQARRRLDHGIRDLADEARRLAASDATRIVERFGQMGVRKITFAA